MFCTLCYSFGGTTGLFDVLLIYILIKNKKQKKKLSDIYKTGQTHTEKGRDTGGRSKGGLNVWMQNQTPNGTEGGIG